MKKIIFFILFLFISTNTLAQDMDLFSQDEENLFEQDTQIEAVSKKDTKITNELIEEKRIDLTGQLRHSLTYSMNRNWLSGNGAWTDNTWSTLTYGDLFFDIRLYQGLKAYIDIGYVNLPATSNTGLASAVDFKEIFIDFNLKDKIYFRTGKQVLKWGRSYFWNPTDLINVESRNFLNLDYLRTGTYGTKAHIPFGYAQNLYFFLNYNQTSNLDDLALATKYEFIAGNSEIGLSLWTKKDAYSVYGLDFSTSLMDFTIYGEMALASNVKPRSSLTLSRNLDFDITDRFSLIYEIFYNGQGYNKKVTLNPTSVFTANELSTWYSAMFFSINKYPWTYFTTSLHALVNMVDRSFIVSLGTKYTSIHNFDLAFTTNYYFGPENAEYTYLGQGMDVRFEAGIQF
ncbi:hypothetical protein ACFL2K_03970 [Candidatus Margulisiibacteriota bacterium]